MAAARPPLSGSRGPADNRQQAGIGNQVGKPVSKPVSKRSNGVTIGTHRLGIRLWITSGPMGEKLCPPPARRCPVPSRPVPPGSPHTPPVGPGNRADLHEWLPSPVSTVPTTTTILNLYPADSRKPARQPQRTRSGFPALAARAGAGLTQEYVMTHTDSPGGSL
jgi:hypothetical protein